MREELTKQILALIEQGKNIDFMELEIVRQYLQWYFVLHIAGIVFSMLVFGGACIFLIRRFAKNRPLDFEDASLYWIGIFLSSSVGFGLFLYNLLNLIKIIVMPELYIVQEIAGMLR